MYKKVGLKTERDTMEGQHVDRRIILKMCLRYGGRVWTAYLWIRIGGS
jgi:hypothetical protein